MVKIVVTHKVASHAVNPLYKCAVIHFEPSDSHFRIERQNLADGTVSIANYMPKNEEIAELVDKVLSAAEKKQAVNLLNQLKKVLEKHSCSLDYKVEWFL